MNKPVKNESKNEIVVYQPNETMRLEVRMQDETVWLAQSQMAELFGCTVRNVRMHLANVYACGELDEASTRKDFFLFLIIDDRRLYLIGASLKDLGAKCFAFTQLDPAEIPNLKSRIP